MFGPAVRDLPSSDELKELFLDLVNDGGSKYIQLFGLK